MLGRNFLFTKCGIRTELTAHTIRFPSSEDKNVETVHYTNERKRLNGFRRSTSPWWSLLLMSTQIL